MISVSPIRDILRTPPTSPKLFTTNFIIFIVIVVLIFIFIYSKQKSVSTKRTHFNIFNYKKTERLTTTTSNKPQLKIFYANWCGWSKRILAILNSPEFKTAYETVKNKCDIVLVDCENSGKDECKANNIRGYPTIILFKDNKSIEYNGERTVEAIIKYIAENC
jgi:thiol-disulfide isomerase/thioredoxin